jgi:tetratricopeptide (TPR) repeat protein
MKEEPKLSNIPDFIERSTATSGPSLAEINRLDSLFGNSRYAELEQAARALINQHPNAGIVWKLLGLSLQMQSKDALSTFKKAAELLPNDAEAHANLAGALRATGHFQAAVESGQQALKIKPNFAEAHNNLGVALQDLDQTEAAIASYCRAIELKPNFAEAHSNLGSALKDLEQFHAAVASYQRALEINPDYAKVHSNLGVAQWCLGEFDSAAKSFNRALELDPLCKEALLGISQLCMESGELESAGTLLQTILKISPDNLESRFLLAKIGKAKLGDENMAALIAAEKAAQIGELPLTSKQAIRLHFALGKSFDDCGNYAQAFPYFIEGCKLKRATFNHDAEQVSQHFNDIIRVFNKETIARLSGYGDSSHLPIFVLGMPRSGTTLTEQIIASHPDVYGAGELPDLLDIAERDVMKNGTTYPNNIASIDPEILTAWAKEYVSGLQKRAPDAQRITNKMPANFFAIGLIHTMLPNAKIIHVNRNPVDTCLSCFTQLFDVGQYHTYNLTELGRYYVDYARLMEHWRSVLSADAFLDVQYEDIVANQETQARRMIEFCNLNWSDACIDFHENKRSVQTASLIQVRQPIYKTSVERWKRYEKFIGPLLDALGDFSPRENKN